MRGKELKLEDLGASHRGGSREGGDLTSPKREKWVVVVGSRSFFLQNKILLSRQQLNLVIKVTELNGAAYDALYSQYHSQCFRFAFFEKPQHALRQCMRKYQLSRKQFLE